MKWKVAFVWIISMIGLGVFMKCSDDKQMADNSMGRFRHKISKSDLKKQKKYILSQSTPSKKTTSKSTQKSIRDLAQASQVVDVANPMEKREELKREFSRRGSQNSRRGTLEPDAKIVYGDGNGNEYKLIKDYVAVKKTKENENDYPDAELKLGYFIVPVNQAPNDAQTLLENASTGNIVIFTGLIKVKLTDIRQAESLISSVSYHIPVKYEHIGLVMYKFDSYQDTMDAKRELDRSQFVQRATIELLEYARIPQ